MLMTTEPKCQFNTRKLQPVPDWIPITRQAHWRAAWRDFYQHWRYQISEDRRFWLTCAETVGREITCERLGPQDRFNLINNL
ncbi:hypothetical protein [Roseinatronobacter sp. S2]|uniref:hypothetical protein n=1 Tax=Roseinatronobacter sp. S2 TaxID=3035471 RepID=UPI002410621C|nr:hypothetical protein [Roseinatronobacter sp. S2]WFE73369.1 hypothetical protein P8S53_09225 [Roseinatronobacter sp. S2]